MEPQQQPVPVPQDVHLTPQQPVPLPPNIHLTPPQLQALKDLNHGRIPQLLFPLPSGTIGFDTYPIIYPGHPERQLQPIPDGTNLAANDQQPYVFQDGVTLSNPLLGSPPDADQDTFGVFAWRDNWTPRNNGTNNVISPIGHPDPNHGVFSEKTINAQFSQPVRTVSIDAYPSWIGGYGCPDGQPYLWALDINQHEIRDQYPHYKVFPVSGCQGGQPNPAWTSWQTITITRPQADSYGVELGVVQGSNGWVYAMWDNLSFSR